METLLIQTENGPVLVNKVDFDPATMVLVGSSVPDVPQPSEPQQGAPAPQAAAPVVQPTAPPTMLVTKDGRKFVVVGADQARIVSAGIDPEGYKTEADAWAAITALAAANNA